MDYFLQENLWEIIQTLLKDKSSSYDSPAIVYTRMEIIGKEQLQQKTLKDLGLVSGKALLRFDYFLLAFNFGRMNSQFDTFLYK